jgi:predicted DNA-binding protein
VKTNTQPLFSFRVTESFVDTTTQYAKLTGVSRSEYARQAIEEKNHRIMAERIHILSKQLSAQSIAVNEALDDTLSDGLHD